MPKKASTLIVGVSGGIDSAVVSTISSMTGINTIVLSMPIRQIKSQDDLSKLHCNNIVEFYRNFYGLFLVNAICCFLLI